MLASMGGFRVVLLCAACAACATAADELRPLSTAEVCYLGVTQQYEYRRAADAELKRRGEKCEDHRDEILAIHERAIDAARSRPAGGQVNFPQPVYGLPPGAPK